MHFPSLTTIPGTRRLQQATATATAMARRYGSITGSGHGKVIDLWASINQGSRHTMKIAWHDRYIDEDINCTSSSAPNDVKMPAHILCVSETRAALW